MAGRRFAAVGWPAFAVLLATGVWNVVAVRDQTHSAYRTTLVVKLAVVALSGVAAAAHQRAKRLNHLRRPGVAPARVPSCVS